MSGRDKQDGRDIGNVKKQDGAEREQRERQEHKDHVEIVRAIDRIPDQLAANEKEQDSGDKKRRFREWLTISLILVTAVVAGVGDGIFYSTMVDDRINSAKALQRADTANQQAREFFEADQAPTIWLVPSGEVGSREGNATVPLFVPYHDVGKMPLPDTGDIVWMFHFKNYGRGTAIQTGESVQLYIRGEPCILSTADAGLTMPPEYDQWTAVRCEFMDNQRNIQRTFTKDEFSSLINSSGGIEARIWQTYKDQYGNIYESDYCYIWDGGDGRGVNGSPSSCTPNGYRLKQKHR